MNYNDHHITGESQENLKVFLLTVKRILKFVSRPDISEGDLAIDGKRGTVLFDKDYGICGFVSRGVSAEKDMRRFDTDDVLRYCFERWPHFTGRFSYPVPVTSDISASNPERAFDSCNHWKGKQLEMREDLLNFIVRTITPFIKEQ